MIRGLSMLITNVGMSFENIVLLIIIVGGMIFYAKDFKLGLVIQFLGSGVLFLWFQSAGYNYTPSLITFFITLVLMCFSIYAAAKNESRGAIV